ncbi:hypothetical protein ACFPTR_09595 [Aliibacillus thermotolerans]|uniref:Uncharacterized protein n=1 Tax=Aliibacillus thermotolerans TaxID=1834418 RepID=A0ABW0UAV6_9BACI
MFSIPVHIGDFVLVKVMYIYCIDTVRAIFFGQPYVKQRTGENLPRAVVLQRMTVAGFYFIDRPLSFPVTIFSQHEESPPLHSLKSLDHRIYTQMLSCEANSFVHIFITQIEVDKQGKKEAITIV